MTPTETGQPKNQFGAIWSTHKDFWTILLEVPTCLFRGTNTSFPETRLHFWLKSAESLRSDTLA